MFFDTVGRAMMITDIWASFYGAIFGAVISGGSLFLADIYKEHRLHTSKGKLFILAIKDDLENSIPLYEKIQEDWQKNKDVWLAYLTEIRESRLIYIRNLDNLLYIPKQIKRRTVSKYYYKSGSTIAYLDTMQNRKMMLQTGQLKPSFDNELNWVNERLQHAIYRLEGIKQDAERLLDAISNIV